MPCNIKSSCSCSLGFAQQTPTPSDEKSNQRLVEVMNFTRTEVIPGPSLPELQHGSSSQSRVVFSQRVINRSRSHTVPCYFPQPSPLHSTRTYSSSSNYQLHRSPLSSFQTIQHLYGEESESDISVCDTAISVSTDDSRSNSDETQISEATTTGDDESSLNSKADQFFDEDVVFSPVPSIITGPINFSFIERVKREDAKRRIVKMVEKEPVAVPKVLNAKCDGIPLAVKQDIITWLIDFEHGFNDYPSISIPTRHRAIILFHQFCALDTMSNIDTDRIKLRAHRIGVACLTLACKVDIDFLAPLDVVPLLLWECSIANSGWVYICAEQIGMFEQIILETLSYRVIFPTPCDFLTELLIAIPMLENLVYHCVEDWKLVEEAFSLIYEHAYHHSGYPDHRPYVLTVAVLLTCLDECIFDYPHSQTVKLGQVWWRDTDGDWTETRVKDSLEQVSYNIASDRKMGEWVHLSEEVIKTSICEIMGLKESEVDQCKKWCAAL